MRIRYDRNAYEHACRKLDGVPGTTEADREELATVLYDAADDWLVMRAVDALANPHEPVRPRVGRLVDGGKKPG